MSQRVETGHPESMQPSVVNTLLPSAMLNYSNDLLCAQMQRNLALSEEKAQILFEDLKRYLSLGFYTKLSLPPPRMIDKGWHEFILMTRDYSDFCHEYRGQFIHHQPTRGNTSGEDVAIGRHRTRILASQLFGTLSVNWD